MSTVCIHWEQVEGLVQSSQNKDGLELQSLLSDTRVQVNTHSLTH
jgi:hypothetical protein